MSSEESLPLVYANVMAAHASAFDVAMDFGHRVGEDEPEFEVRVAMSWEHAVSMVAILQRLIESYQGSVGPLPDVEKAARAAEESA
jgi:hypothetical protein